MFVDRISEALEYVFNRTTLRPKTGIILGSGLGSFADSIPNSCFVPTATIPNHPVSTVQGHAGKWVFADVEGQSILAMQGRIHLYEGYPIEDVTFPIHLMAELGIETLIVTNAAGGYNPNFEPGDLMLITDHINLMFDNPLRGSDSDLGPRFPDMSRPYDAQLMSIARDSALELRIKLREGVLAAIKGPSYETGAEVRMLKTLGADAGSMSTVPEVITAVVRGLRLLGISCITNLGTGLSSFRLSHEEVTEVAQKSRSNFSSLLRTVIRKIS